MKYSQIITFTKFTNLLPYAEKEAIGGGNIALENNPRAKEYYAKNRNVTLNVYVRFTRENKTFCKIQCPINPLPIKGEFEVPTLYILKKFLADNGWQEINQVLIPRTILGEM